MQLFSNCTLFQPIRSAHVSKFDESRYRYNYPSRLTLATIIRKWLLLSQLSLFAYPFGILLNLLSLQMDGNSNKPCGRGHHKRRKNNNNQPCINFSIQTFMHCRYMYTLNKHTDTHCTLNIYKSLCMPDLPGPLWLQLPDARGHCSGG